VISSADDAAGAINARSPGDEITLTIEHGGEQSTIDVTLGTRPT
jgi:S1-C subfamily serine protease